MVNLKLFITKILPSLKNEKEYKEKQINWVFERLSPHFDPKFHGKIIKQLEREIDEKQVNVNKQGKSLEQYDNEITEAINAELKREHEIMKSDYVITIHEFNTFIAPTLQLFSFMPDCEPETLINLASKDYITSSKAKDNLLSICDTHAVSTVITALCRNYEKLRNAQIAKLPNVKLLSDQKSCKKCRDISGQIFNVDELLKQYAEGKIQFPHELPSDDCILICANQSLVSTRDGAEELPDYF